MTPSEVVGRIFLPADELLGVKQLPVRASSHFVNHGGFQVQEQAARDVFPRSRFTKERVEGVVSSSHRLITWHLTIRLHRNQSNNQSINQFITPSTSKHEFTATRDILRVQVKGMKSNEFNVKSRHACPPGCHARDNRAPNRHSRFECRPGQRGWKGTLS